MQRKLCLAEVVPGRDQVGSTCYRGLSLTVTSVNGAITLFPCADRDSI